MNYACFYLLFVIENLLPKVKVLLSIIKVCFSFVRGNSKVCNDSITVIFIIFSMVWCLYVKKYFRFIS